VVLKVSHVLLEQGQSCRVLKIYAPGATHHLWDAHRLISTNPKGSQAGIATPPPNPVASRQDKVAIPGHHVKEWLDVLDGPHGGVTPKHAIEPSISGLCH
jgi:hypothetical protein